MEKLTTVIMIIHMSVSEIHEATVTEDRPWRKAQTLVVEYINNCTIL